MEQSVWLEGLTIATHEYSQWMTVHGRWQGPIYYTSSMQIYNGIKRTWREQGLITKRCVVMHIYKLIFISMVLYSSVLVMKLFNSSRKQNYCFEDEVQCLLLWIHQLTFITEALHLVATVRWSFCSQYHSILVFLIGI